MPFGGVNRMTPKFICQGSGLSSGYLGIGRIFEERPHQIVGPFYLLLHAQYCCPSPHNFIHQVIIRNSGVECGVFEFRNMLLTGYSGVIHFDLLQCS
jgi:hypothetical protein